MALSNYLFLGSLSAATAVAMGSFGAHGLKSRVSPEGLQTFEVACRYQMYHAFAMISCHFGKLSSPSMVGHHFDLAGKMFLFGTVLFSGSLYALVFSGIKKFGIITPIGGTGFIIGWCILAYGALRAGNK